MSIKNVRMKENEFNNLLYENFAVAEETKGKILKKYKKTIIFKEFKMTL